MDWMTFLIGIGLLLTGAVFVGYPIGLIRGKRQADGAEAPEIYIYTCGCRSYSEIVSFVITKEEKRNVFNHR